VTRRILACGGRQLFYPGLTRYLFSLARSKRPKVLLIPTASGDSAGYQLTFYQQLGHFDCEPSHLSLFDRTVDDLDALIRAQDIVMVSGGNTANMLAIWRLHGVEDALRNAYRSGTILTGWSAGCICWFEAGTTDSFTHELGPLDDGLKILKGSASPHYDSEERRRVVYQREIAAGLPAGIALEDGVAALYEDERLSEVVTGRDGGRAFNVDRSGERPIATRLVS
jgi:peptidase E